MSVLAGWESATLTPGRPAAGKLTHGRAPLPVGPSRPATPAGWTEPARPRQSPRRRPVRRPAGLAAALPPRLPVAACAPNYARRRLVALLVVGLLAAVVVVALGMLRVAAADDGVPDGTAVVEVRQGESLWELAERVAPQSPPQAVVERIRELNGMHGSTVHPGQPLLVPDAG